MRSIVFDQASVLKTHPGQTAQATHKSLFFEVIGEGDLAGEKAACRVARLIEEELIAAGWPIGAVYGSEGTIAAQFGVGRAIVREVVRVLEARGCARMFRGPNGGLKVVAPDRGNAADLVAGYCLLAGVEEADLEEAKDVLARLRRRVRDGEIFDDPSKARMEGMALGFFEQVLQAVASAFAGAEGHPALPALAATKVFQRSRAGQIVRRLMSECSPAEWVRGHRLGSEEDLCVRYGADRDVFRQAVRVLESAGMAESVCGRGHGLISRPPRSSAVSRMVTCDFAASGLGVAQVTQLFHWLSIESAAISAARASASDCDQIEQALRRLESAVVNGDPSETFAGLYQCEERQFAIMRNPLLIIFLQGARAYASVDIPHDLSGMEGVNKVFIDLTRAVLSALRRSDPKAAAQAQLEKILGLKAAMDRFPWHRHLGVSPRAEFN